MSQFNTLKWDPDNNHVQLQITFIAEFPGIKNSLRDVTFSVGANVSNNQMRDSMIQAWTHADITLTSGSNGRISFSRMFLSPQLKIAMQQLPAGRTNVDLNVDFS